MRASLTRSTKANQAMFWVFAVTCFLVAKELPLSQGFATCQTNVFNGRRTMEGTIAGKMDQRSKLLGMKPKSSVLSRMSLVDSRSHLCALSDDNNGAQEDKPASHISRRKYWRRRIAKWTQTVLLASSLWASRSKPAEAKFSYEIREERKYSIRPGSTQQQASQLVEGEVPDDLADAKSIFNSKGPTSSTTSSKRATEAPKKATFDYGDEDDDDDFVDFEDAEMYGEAPVTSKAGRGTSGVGGATASSADKAVSERLQSSTRSSFAGIDTSKTKNRALTIKVSVGLFIPTWGAMGVREFVRRRKEEAYVQKGLEILEAQKAEYFNVTETTPDSDIEDELKDIKGDDDEDDDDGDDDEDDDDNEEEDDIPPPSSRKGPRRPPGDGSGGGSNGEGGSGNGRDAGDGKPTDDDLKRLGDLFNKS